MATPKFNSKSPTIKRILKEASELSTNPSPDYHALPASDADLFDWHFTIRGPPGTPYSAGIYHGRIVLPPTYPLRPPSFRFLTPSGRFEVNREICLSISGHHEETWQPAWGIRTALVALRAFMESDAKGQLGGLESSKKDRERLAGLSSAWKCGTCGRSNEAILVECSADAKRKEEADAMQGKEPKKSEVEIPQELKLGYRDELAGPVTEKTQGTDEATEEAELAEGFVQTAPLLASGQSSSAIPAAEYPRARPGQTVPQPTGSASVPTSQTQTQTQRAPPPPEVTEAARLVRAYHQQQAAQRRSNDGVPVWIDRSIAAVVLCLVVMVLKILLGL